MYINCVLATRSAQNVQQICNLEPADRECDDLWAVHYVIAPMRDHIH